MLKVYQCDDYDFYAAQSPEQADGLLFDMTGEHCEDDYPRELTAADLDATFPELDEKEQPTGSRISIRHLLEEHGDVPGWLFGIE